MLPPKSLPIPSGDPRAARIAASPPLDPPHVRPKSHGLFVRPYTGLSDSCQIINCGIFVLPMTIAPARRSRDTEIPSFSTGFRNDSLSKPIVDGVPAR